MPDDTIMRLRQELARSNAVLRMLIEDGVFSSNWMRNEVVLRLVQSERVMKETVPEFLSEKT